MTDTTISGKRVRYIIAPESLDELGPIVNIIVQEMLGQGIDEFTDRNMNYLGTNSEGVTILEKGTIDVSGVKARWFTYTKVTHGTKRELINYIIPIRGYAYMMTGGTYTGGMKKLRKVFDGMARSIKG